MFKFVILCSLLAIAAAKPGHLFGAPALRYAYPLPAPAVHSYAVPEVATYAAPAVTAVARHGFPSAFSHTTRTDVFHSPAITTYAAAAPVIAAPIARAAYTAPLHLGYSGYAGTFGYAGHGGYGLRGYGY